jgi:hypothetical protein
MERLKVVIQISSKVTTLSNVPHLLNGIIFFKNLLLTGNKSIPYMITDRFKAFENYSTHSVLLVHTVLYELPFIIILLNGFLMLKLFMYLLSGCERSKVSAAKPEMSVSACIRDIHTIQMTWRTISSMDELKKLI